MTAKRRASKRVLEPPTGVGDRALLRVPTPLEGYGHPPVPPGAVHVLALRLPVELVSLNAVKGRHWSARSRFRRELSWALAWAGVHHYEPLQPPPTGKRLVRVARIIEKRGRMFDEENLTGGNMKTLIDLLTERGAWPDDSPKHLERVAAQLRRDDPMLTGVPAGIGVLVDVYELPG